MGSFLNTYTHPPCRQPPEMSTTATAAAAAATNGTNGTKRACEEEVGAVDAVAEKETPTLEAEQQTPKKAMIDSSSPVCPPAPQKKQRKQKKAAAEKEEVVDADYQSVTEDENVKRLLENVKEQSLDPKHVCSVLSSLIEAMETSELDETLSVLMVKVALKTQLGISSEALPNSLAGFRALHDSVKSM